MDPRTTITGNAGGDAVFRVTPNGTQIAEFGLAHTRRILKDGLWQDGDTTWYNVKSFGRLADNVAASIRKGDGVVATGRLEIDTWTGADGGTRTKTSLVADAVGHDLSRGTTTLNRPVRPHGVSASDVEHPAEPEESQLPDDERRAS